MGEETLEQVKELSMILHHVSSTRCDKEVLINVEECKRLKGIQKNKCNNSA